MLSSMTGFARVSGHSDGAHFVWELRSVNGKGLEARLRLPPGYDALDAELKALVAKRLTRGNLSATLTLERDAAQPDVRVNEVAVERLARLAGQIARDTGMAPPTLDGLLNVRGMVEIVDASETDAQQAETAKAVGEAFAQALERLMAMRKSEGQALATLLRARLDEIAALKAEAEHNPARQPEAIKRKLTEGLKALMEQPFALDSARLHLEALMLAAKADIREELDRLDAHVAAARALLDEGGAVGRKLDFLAQEFNRETNTLCSKSNDVSLTNTGLKLKAVVEQFREQVQNLE